MNLKNKNKSIKDINFFAIYDGHGGKAVSKSVSDILPVYFLDSRLTYPLDKRYVKKVYNHVESIIEQNPNCKECGSTSLTMSHYKVGKSEYIDLTNLGDCRGVLCKDNKAVTLTRDHRPMWPEEKKRIEQLGGKITFDNDDWRVMGYSVSRSFGDVNAKPFLSHEPDLYRYKLESKDKFVVLGCDGLWDYVNEQDVINFILGNVYVNGKKKIENTKHIAKKVGNLALAKGSTDNVSAIIVFFE
jgi:serine/threonine protein phosphatase PrpC